MVTSIVNQAASGRRWLIVDSSEAIEFLVQQVVEQASMEGASLSEPEKRRLYSRPDDTTDDDFATQNLIVYEGKVSTLLHHAYARTRDGESGHVETWSRAIRALRGGDYYLLQLWDILPETGRSSKGLFTTIGIGSAAAIGVLVAILVWVALAHPN